MSQRALTTKRSVPTEKYWAESSRKGRGGGGMHADERNEMCSIVHRFLYVHEAGTCTDTPHDLYVPGG